MQVKISNFRVMELRARITAGFGRRIYPIKNASQIDTQRGFRVAALVSSCWEVGRGRCIK